jgi:hypothetical protein
VPKAIDDRSRREHRLDAVTQTGDAILLGAVIAAVKSAACFQTVPDDPNAAMLAGWRQRVDRALETVKRMGLAPHNNVEGLVVIVATGFAGWHEHHSGFEMEMYGMTSSSPVVAISCRSEPVEAFLLLVAQ